LLRGELIPRDRRPHNRFLDVVVWIKSDSYPLSRFISTWTETSWQEETLSSLMPPGLIAADWLIFDMHGRQRFATPVSVEPVPLDLNATSLESSFPRHKPPIKLEDGFASRLSITARVC
jgi:hypothetical protein